MARALSSSFAQQFRSAPVRLSLIALALLMPVATALAIFIGNAVNDLIVDETLSALRRELHELRLQFDRGGIQQLTAAVREKSEANNKSLYRLGPPEDGATGVVGNLRQRPHEISTGNGIFKVPAAGNQDVRTAVGIEMPVLPSVTLIVARDIDEQRALAARLQRLAFASLSLIAIISLGFGLWSSRRLSARVADVTTTAQSIMEGDFRRRIRVDGSGDEFDELATSLNAMLGRIEDLMQALREVSDNIAHDLKTPITRLRNKAEAALRENAPTAHRDALERVIEEADGLIQTFNALLLIARLEAGAVDATRAECDVAEVVKDVAELYQPVADEGNLRLVVQVPEIALARINRHLVGQALANMIDNAIKYSQGTPHAGEEPIVISVSRSSAGEIEISVADHGPGIPIADRERATKRFVRLEQSRSRPGTGLGLSLVAAVARLHGGAFRLEDNAPGLKAVLMLPQAKGPKSTDPLKALNLVESTDAVAR